MKMKKYVLIGLVAGVTLSILLFLYRRRELRGTEFQDFLDSQTVANDLFGNAFRELPDKL
jgi:hypothetical protein